MITQSRPENPRPSVVLSVVVPVFNEATNVLPLVEAVRPVLDALGMTYEVILVDDGSSDGTWPMIRKMAQEDGHIKGLSLSRNFGHQNALFAGMHIASGEAIVTMDGDLQHPPATIPGLVAAWRNGYKIVDTKRSQSADTTIAKRVTSRWFYRAFSLLSGMPMEEGKSDFRLVDRQVAEAMKMMRDADLFLRGIAHWVGFPRTTIAYQAAERHSGRSKYGFTKMLRFAVSSLFAFSIVPLRLGIWVGLATSGIAFLELIYIIIRYFQGESVAGWASTLTVISFMFGVLFVLIGLIGAYLGSIFETLKNRPRFLVNESVNLFDEH